MPALVAGIHVLLSRSKEGVDGRDKPGHDDGEKRADEAGNRCRTTPHNRLALAQH
jgi:hypothetical protein